MVHMHHFPASCGPGREATSWRANMGPLGQARDSSAPESRLWSFHWAASPHQQPHDAQDRALPYSVPVRAGGVVGQSGLVA